MALGAYVPLLWYPSAPDVSPPPYCITSTVAPLYNVQGVAASAFKVTAGNVAPLYSVSLRDRGPLFSVSGAAGGC